MQKGAAFDSRTQYRSRICPDITPSFQISRESFCRTQIAEEVGQGMRLRNKQLHTK